jgi:hypothetical protein
LFTCAVGWVRVACAQGSKAPSATEQTVEVALHCTPRVGKGRVLCDADLTVKSGRLSWADVIITKAPAFAPPLRDRVGMREATDRSATHLRLPFALIAQQPGAGEVTIQGRAVWCRPGVERELCLSSLHTISAPVVVTQDTDSPAPG